MDRAVQLLIELADAKDFEKTVECGSDNYNEVMVEEGAEVVDSVIMPGALIKKGAKVYKAMVGPNSIVEENQVIGDLNGEVVLFANGKEN